MKKIDGIGAPLAVCPFNFRVRHSPPSAETENQGLNFQK